MINARNKFIFLAFLVAISLWLIEVTLHVVVFRTGNFTEEIFGLHDLNELWMRIIIVIVVMSAGVISQRMANKITLSYEKERETTEKLEASIKEVKLLQGILPICASCKNIRDDKGYWSQVESYITDHSEAKFSHSICPDCAKKLYPEIYQELSERLESNKVV